MRIVDNTKKCLLDIQKISRLRKLSLTFVIDTHEHHGKSSEFV